MIQPHRRIISLELGSTVPTGNNRMVRSRRMNLSSSVRAGAGLLYRKESYGEKPPENERFSILLRCVSSPITVEPCLLYRKESYIIFVH